MSKQKSFNFPPLPRGKENQETFAKTIAKISAKSFAGGAKKDGQIKKEGNTYVVVPKKNDLES